ncbi:HAD family hydrolase [Alteromonas pelagimontana]|uniref:D,D-heptose 1,7-bisphosphate phosphatase n=1 Tax=Alteromonas pelagimontana TaxID=1858656 RepID=A0A6M4MHH1_9ALTE|nr:HAD family hydrolase [Alteromonas pelagimontana]QJR82559.1 HAD family hydrolase [Alteromonas pelagimontana]
MKKALFLDRDGVINIDKGYVSRVSDFIFVEGIFKVIQRFCDKGMFPVIVTNQSGIGRGMYSEQEFAALSTWMQKQFQAHHLPTIPVYFCPHHPVEGKGQYKKLCNCRKPHAGMLLQAAADHNIDLTQSSLIGDSWRDIEAGENAGLKQLFYVSTNPLPATAIFNSNIKQVATVKEILSLPGCEV